MGMKKKVVDGELISLTIAKDTRVLAKEKRGFDCVQDYIRALIKDDLMNP